MARKSFQLVPRRGFAVIFTVLYRLMPNSWHQKTTQSLDICYHRIPHLLEPSITSTEHEGQPTHDRAHVALIAQLGEHCSGNANVVSSHPVQSRKFFSGHFSNGVAAVNFVAQ